MSVFGEQATFEHLPSLPWMKWWSQTQKFAAKSHGRTRCSRTDLRCGDPAVAFEDSYTVALWIWEESNCAKIVLFVIEPTPAVVTWDLPYIARALSTPLVLLWAAVRWPRHRRGSSMGAANIYPYARCRQPWTYAKEENRTNEAWTKTTTTVSSAIRSTTKARLPNRTPWFSRRSTESVLCLVEISL